jgi:hypothetical protein
VPIKITDDPTTPETRVSGIPVVTEDLRVLTRAVRAMKDVLEVREGKRGSSLDQNVTVRDLYESGVVNITVGGDTYTGDGTTGSVTPSTPPPVLATPPKPTGFSATGGFSNIYLAWDVASGLYSNHSYTEVWRNTVDNFGTATLVGETAASFFADPVGNDTTYYYWIRFVSNANRFGPINATAGTSATTSPDPDYLISVLKSKITADLAAGNVLRIGNNTGQTDWFDTVIVEAGTFAVANTSGGVTKIPFIVDSGTVYMDVAMIKNASITSAKISDLVADKITAGTINVAITLNAATINGGSLNINNRFKVFSDGTTWLYTDHFYIVDPTSGTGSAVFYVDSGHIYMDNAFIKNLSANTIVSTDGSTPLFNATSDRLSVRGNSDSGSTQVAYIYVNEVINNNNNTGYMIWVWNRSTHALTDPPGYAATYASYRSAVGKYQFNTYGSLGNQTQMANFLNGLGSSYVVAVASGHYIETYSGLVTALKRCGATLACTRDSSNNPAGGGFYYYSPYALVGVPGCGEGHGAESSTEPGFEASVEIMWSGDQINGSGFGVNGMTLIQGGKIVTGSITANSIAAATITGTQIAASTITASHLSVSSLSAITATLGTVTAGQLQVSKLETGCSVIDPNAGAGYATHTFATTAAGAYNMGSTTGSLSTSVATSTNIRLYGPTAGGAGSQTVKTGGVPVVVTFSGTVDHHLSLWYRVNGGSWSWLYSMVEPQSSYGTVSFAVEIAVSLSASDYIDFGVSVTASDGTTIQNAGATEIKYGSMSVIAFNL